MENNLYSIYVEIGKKDGAKFYTKDGSKVPHIQFQETIYRDFEVYCSRLFRQFEAISDTDNINISVMYFSEMTKTYPVLYSYYGKEKRFITH